MTAFPEKNILARFHFSNCAFRQVGPMNFRTADQANQGRLFYFNVTQIT